LRTALAHITGLEFSQEFGSVVIAGIPRISSHACERLQNLL